MSAMVKEVYDAFRSAGVSDEQAAEAALAIPPRDDLATKTHLAEFRTEVKTDIGKLRTEFSELRSEVKTDIAKLRTEFSELRSEVKSDIAELRAEIQSNTTELRAEIKSNTTELRAEISELRADTRSDMKDLELRMTLRLFAAVGLAVAAIKALDFLIG